MYYFSFRPTIACTLEKWLIDNWFKTLIWLMPCMYTKLLNRFPNSFLDAQFCNLWLNKNTYFLVLQFILLVYKLCKIWFASLNCMNLNIPHFVHNIMKGVHDRDIKCIQVDKLLLNIYSSSPLGIIIPFKSFFKC